MRVLSISVLTLVTLAAPAQAQQQYAGKEQEGLRRCFDDSVMKLGEQKVPLSDFAVIAVGLCDAPIKVYRDFIMAFEQRRGSSGNVLQARAEAALTSEFRRAKEAYVAYLKKGTERKIRGTPGEVEA